MKTHIYKIPFRNVYCENLTGWLREMLWCFVFMPSFKRKRADPTEAMGAETAP